MGMETYSGGRGESVLDYVVRDREMWDRIEKVRMEEKVDSDHFPVMVWIKGEEEGIRKRKSGKEVGRRWRWTEEGKGIFRERMKRVWGERREEREMS
ncbi:hypothetical protein P5V15_011710 [Pogonomyrmex californicus]